MEQSRPRKHQEDALIVDSNKSWLKEAVLLFFSLVMWIYVGTVALFFPTIAFKWENALLQQLGIYFKVNSQDLLLLLLTLFIIFISAFILLWLWRFYNYIRFRNNKRRTYQTHATKEDLLALDLLSEEDYKRLQQKVVTLETNPLKELH